MLLAYLETVNTYLLRMLSPSDCNLPRSDFLNNQRNACFAIELVSSCTVMSLTMLYEEAVDCLVLFPFETYGQNIGMGLQKCFVIPYRILFQLSDLLGSYVTLVK